MCKYKPGYWIYQGAARWPDHAEIRHKSMIYIGGSTKVDTFGIQIIIWNI